MSTITKYTGMKTITSQLVTTQDTGEEIAGISVLPHAHNATGYQWIDRIDESGWRAIPSWGSDAYHLGEWPYVVVAATDTADSKGKLFGVAINCEGDVTTTYYRTQRAQWEAITEHAFFYWKNGQASGPSDLPVAAAELPSRDRMPFTGRFD
jgi:hypothetical protein